MLIIGRITSKILEYWGQKNGSLFNPDENDTILVGYPKSGNTWLDFLIACIVTSNVVDVDFISIEKIVADIYLNNGYRLERLARPRILKSHEPYNPRYKKVIYIIRDPRAVAVSYYYHHIRLKTFDSDYAIEKFVEKMIDGYWDTFGAWDKHVLGWVEKKKDNNSFLLMKYEDMKNNINAAVAQLGALLDIQCNHDKQSQIIDWCSLENMRRLDARRPQLNNIVKGMLFVRQGKSNGWRDILDDASRERIEDSFHAGMREVGYL